MKLNFLDQITNVGKINSNKNSFILLSYDYLTIFIIKIIIMYNIIINIIYFYPILVDLFI